MPTKIYGDWLDEQVESLPFLIQHIVKCYIQWGEKEKVSDFLKKVEDTVRNEQEALARPEEGE